MKKYTKVSLFLMVIIIASLFTGCNQEEKGFMEALMKNQEILKLESTSNMEFDLKVEGLDEETQVIFDEFLNQINDMKLSIKQKSVTNEEKTVSKAQLDANVKLSDMSFDSSIWVDVDLSGDKPILKEIFKLPSMLMGFIPGAAEKEYIVLDFDTIEESIANMEEDMPESIGLDETMAIAMKYQEKFMDAFIKYMKKYDSGLSVISKLDDKMVDGEKIEYYQVAFDDESFKEFLKYTAISMLQDENIIPLFKEYMTELMDASGEEMPEELSKTANIADMVKKTREFFNKLEELTILGEEGILIAYGINKDGYFVSEEGKMDFLIDTKQFMDLTSDSIKDNESLQEIPTPIFELLISYDTKINNINQDIEVTMPKTTEENSMDYMELIKTTLETVVPENLQDMGLMVIVEDEFVEFTDKPILVDNHYLVPSRDIAKAFDVTVDWNEDTREISMTKNEKQLTFNVKNNQLLVNGESQTLNTPVIIKNGVSFIPLRAVSENFGYNVEWDKEFKIILINK